MSASAGAVSAMPGPLEHGLPRARAAPWRQLTALLLPAAALSWAAAHAIGAHQPVESTVVLLLLFPLAALAGSHGAVPRDRACAVVMALSLALLVWTLAVDLFAPGVLPAARWRPVQRTAALALMLAAACSGVAAARLLTLQGIAAAATALVAVLANAMSGTLTPGNTACVGFGHINILLNTAGPSLIAWTALRLHDRTAMPRWHGWIWAAGCGAVIATAWLAERRGVTLAVGSVVALVALRSTWRRSRIAAVSAAGIACIGALVAAWALFDAGTVTPRMQRVLLYRAGLEGAWSGLPWGLGDAGALRLVSIDGEAARHCSANGWGTHIHNEFLEALLCGGPVALLLLAAGGALLAWRTWRAEDPSLRDAGLALGAAVLVHMLTDNVYGSEVGELWLGANIGILLAIRVPSPESASPATRGARWPRAMAWMLALGAAYGAARTIPAALVDADASTAVHWQRFPQALNPQTALAHAFVVLRDPGLSPKQRLRVAEAAAERVGWVPPLAAEALTAARGIDDPATLRIALLRCAWLQPLRNDLWSELHARGMSGSLPERLRLRCRLAAGDPGLPMPDLGLLPDGIERAADLHAAVAWTLATRAGDDGVAPALRRLVERYGDLGELAPTLVRAASLLPIERLEWTAAYAATLRPHLALPRTIAVLESVSDPAQARRLLATLAAIEPSAAADPSGLPPALTAEVTRLRFAAAR